MKKTKLLAIIIVATILFQSFVYANMINVKAESIPTATTDSNSQNPGHLSFADVFKDGYGCFALFDLNKHDIFDKFRGNRADHLVISPKVATIAAGQSQTYTVALFSRDGHRHNLSTLSDVIWSINSGAGTYVWTGSTVQVDKAGTWTVTATYKGRSATASLTVTPNRDKLDHITASVNPTTVTAPNTVTGSATAYDVYGNSWDISTLATWSIPAGNDGGSWLQNVYTSHTAGTYTVLSYYEGKSAYATLTVTHSNDVAHLSYITASVKPTTVAAPNTVTGSATAYDIFGNSWDVSTQATWSILGGGDGGSWSNNIYTSHTAGTYTVQAVYQGKTATASLSVTHATNDAYLDHIIIAPKDVTVDAGVSQGYTATAYDTFGNSWIVNAVYSCANSSVVISDNVVYSNVEGSYTVTGTFSGKSDAATLNVVGHLATIVAITVAPKTAAIMAGTSIVFAAKASDGYNIWDVTSIVTWSINTEAGGSWDQNSGTYTSAIAGNWTVKATLGGLSGSASLTVNANGALLDHITISPKTASVSAGISKIFTVTAFDQFGNSLDDVTSSSTFNAPGASVTANSVTANNIGSYSVTATYNGLTDTADLEVTGNSVKFVETGLQTGTSWNITFGGTVYSSVTDTITIDNLSAQDYSWSTSNTIQNSQIQFVTTQTSGSLAVPSQLTQSIVYSAQYLVTYVATGNVLSVSIPADQWINSGGQATGLFQDQVVNSAQDTRCNFVSDNRPLTITQPTTITGTYQTQYYLTVTSPYNTVSGTGWYNSGSTATASLDGRTTSASNGIRHVFSAWSDDASGTALTSSISMTGPKTVAASWDKQYLVTYAATGNSLPITVPSNEWVNVGASAQGQFAPTEVNSNNDTQCLFLNDNRTQSIIQPTTIVGDYQTQFKVTFDQTGVLSDAKGAILSFLGVSEDYSELAQVTWVNKDASVTFSFANTVASNVANKVYVLTGVNVNSPAVINQPTLIQGSYRAEYVTSLYTVLEVVLILLTVSIVAVSLLRYRSQRIRRQQNLNEPANAATSSKLSFFYRKLTPIKVSNKVMDAWKFISHKNKQTH